MSGGREICQSCNPAPFSIYLETNNSLCNHSIPQKELNLVTRTQLAGGVFLTHLPAKKFKTNLLSAQFVVPLRWESASANALLGAILRRGTVSCPDM